MRLILTTNYDVDKYYYPRICKQGNQSTEKLNYPRSCNSKWQNLDFHLSTLTTEPALLVTMLESLANPAGVLQVYPMHTKPGLETVLKEL